MYWEYVLGVRYLHVVGIHWRLILQKYEYMSMRSMEYEYEYEEYEEYIYYIYYIY